MNERELAAYPWRSTMTPNFCIALHWANSRHSYWYYGTSQLSAYRKFIKWIKKTYYRGRQINQLIDQLRVGLVQLQPPTQQSYNEQRLVLLEMPAVPNCLGLHQTQPIDQDWRPDDNGIGNSATGLINTIR